MLRKVSQLLLSLVQVIAQARSCNAELPTRSLATPPPTVETCRVTSVNYITHSLPQQCLKTNWSISVNSTLNGPSSHLNNVSVSETADASPRASTIVPHRNVNGTTSEDDRNPITSQQSQGDEDTSTTAQPESRPTRLSASDTVANEQNTVDAESPLDNAKFLSFEEWKKQNLAESGQSAENMVRKQDSSGPGGERRRPHNALDSLGDEGEIELDFSGFGGATKPLAPKNNSDDQQSKTTGENKPTAVPHSGARSKDAGRTCKERFNYASFDCAANVLKTNPQCKSSSSVLVENKDSYMLNECAADNKFLIVELCDHIQIDTVVLANFEFFSSMFRTFRLSVSDRYPVKIDRWKELGVYEARNSREIQAFLVENPLIWARYLRIEFLTHYGSEYYCPMSLIRVHGTTMMEDYRHQEELTRGEVDPIEDEIDVTVAANDPPNALATTSAAVDYGGPSYAHAINKDIENATEPSGLDHDPMKDDIIPENVASVASQEICTAERSVISYNVLHASCPLSASDEGEGLPLVREHDSMATGTEPSTDLQTPGFSTPVETAALAESSKMSQTSSKSTLTDNPSATSRSSTAAVNNVTNPGQNVAKSTMTGINSTALPTAPPTSKQATQTTNSTTSSVSSASPAAQDSTTAASSAVQTPSQSSTPTPNPPATQESFFKSVHKRLLALEANATLSLQYIESQSALLREAFLAVEKRQISKTSTFLENLNATVLADLTRARADYEQLWQSTVLELAGQREDGKREREMLSERVRMLADEVVGQKRMMAAQATLLLLCLALVVFASFGGGRGDNSIDLGLLQGVQHLVQNRNRLSGAKSSGDLLSRRMWGFESPWISPPQSRHGRGSSGDSKAEWDFHLENKPLPPAPLETMDNEEDKSRAGSEDERDEGPRLEMRTSRSPSDHHSSSENESSKRESDRHRDAANSRDALNIIQDPNDSSLLSVADALSRRTSATHKPYQSAPATPFSSSSLSLNRLESPEG